MKNQRVIRGRHGLNNIDVAVVYPCDSCGVCHLFFAMSEPEQACLLVLVSFDDRIPIALLALIAGMDVVWFRIHRKRVFRQMGVATRLGLRAKWDEICACENWKDKILRVTYRDLVLRAREAAYRRDGYFLE